MNKSVLRSLLCYGALFLVFIFAMQYIARSNAQGILSYSEMVQLFRQEQVQSFTVQDNQVTMTLSDGSTSRCEITDVALFRDDLGDLVQQQWSDGIITCLLYTSPSPRD